MVDRTYRDLASSEDSGRGYEVKRFPHILGNETTRQYMVFPAILTPIRGKAVSLGEKKHHHSWFQVGTGITWAEVRLDFKASKSTQLNLYLRAFPTL